MTLKADIEIKFYPFKVIGLGAVNINTFTPFFYPLPNKLACFYHLKTSDKRPILLKNLKTSDKRPILLKNLRFLAFCAMS